MSLERSQPKSPTLPLHAGRPEDVARAAEILRSGGLVAFPTETVYGLGANALSAEAVERIFAAKQRPAWDPLIVHVASADRVGPLVELDESLSERVHVLAEAFWPGPLTLLLPRQPCVPDQVTAGRPTVGVRVPAHPVARALLEAAGVPVAAPSANRFGHISPTTAQHVFDDLDGRIDAVLDGGACAVGVESTVLDVSRTPLRVYRAGAITAELLRAVTGLEVELFASAAEPQTLAPASLPSPGVGLRHYAPEARLRLSGPSAVLLSQELEDVLQQGDTRVGLMLPRGWALASGAHVDVQPWGDWNDPATLAAGVFAGLRALERRGVEVMVCPLPEPGDLRDALRDRLLKAARPR